MPYVEAATADKERYESEKALYQAALAAWSLAHPIAARRLGGKGSGGTQEAELIAHVPYLPLSKVRKITRLSGAKAVSKDGLFAIVKSAEELVGMLTEQSVVAARKSQRKGVGQVELASVLYGARCADLMQFCHSDLKQATLLAAGAAKARKVSVDRPAREKKARTPRTEGRGADGDDAEGEGKRKNKRARKDKVTEEEEVPAQANTMRDFFSARPMGEPAPAPPADAAFKGRRRRDGDENEFGEYSEGSDDAGAALDDDDDDEMVQGAAPARRRRMVLDDDDDDEEDVVVGAGEEEEEDDDDDEEEEEEDDDDDGGELEELEEDGP
jgi:histone H3/H4